MRMTFYCVPSFVCWNELCPDTQQTYYDSRINPIWRVWKYHHGGMSKWDWTNPLRDGDIFVGHPPNVISPPENWFFVSAQS